MTKSFAWRAVSCQIIERWPRHMNGHCTRHTSTWPAQVKCHAVMEPCCAMTEPCRVVIYLVRRYLSILFFCSNSSEEKKRSLIHYSTQKNRWFARWKKRSPTRNLNIYHVVTSHAVTWITWRAVTKFGRMVKAREWSQHVSYTMTKACRDHTWRIQMWSVMFGHV